MRLLLRSLGRLQHTAEVLAGRKPDPAKIRAIHERGAPPPEASGPSVLFVHPRYWPVHTAWSATIAHALRRRGARVRFLLCDRAMPICETIRLETLYRRELICEACRKGGDELVSAFGHAVVTMSDLVPAERIESLRREAAGLSLADVFGRAVHGHGAKELLMPSLIRQLRRVSMEEEPKAEMLAREYLVAAEVAADAFEALCAGEAPDHVVMINGRLAAESAILALARDRGIGVLSYDHGFRIDTIVLGRDRPAIDYPTDELWEDAAERPLSDAETEAVERYLATRERGDDTIVQYWPEVEEDLRRIREDLRLDDRPLSVLFTNVIWDTAVYGREVCFPGMFEWLFETIEAFRALPDRQLVVRVHPAEVRLEKLPTIETVTARLAERYPELPENVRVVPSESPISSYRLMDLAELGLVYTSTVGLEMAARGKPVITAARTHYRGKGITIDPPDRGAYLARLGERAPAAPEDAKARAWRYLHLFFFRYHVTIEPVHEYQEDRFRLRYESPAELEPGRNPGLDTVVSAILDGGPIMQPSPHAEG